MRFYFILGIQFAGERYCMRPEEPEHRFRFVINGLRNKIYLAYRTDFPFYNTINFPLRQLGRCICKVSVFMLMWVFVWNHVVTPFEALRGVSLMVCAETMHCFFGNFLKAIFPWVSQRDNWGLILQLGTHFILPSVFFNSKILQWSHIEIRYGKIFKKCKYSSCDINPNKSFH